jgi:predicted aspartyl protease
MNRGVRCALALCVATALLSGTGSARATAQSAVTEDDLAEVIIRAPEPRYVAPTQRDRIGRVWVPVFINERGPFRLVLDSGATNSAVIPRVATQLGLSTKDSPQVLMRGVTGSAVTDTVRVQSLAVGDLEVGKSLLPIVADAFGGAEGLLGTEGMADKRIYIDFRHDFVNISRSRNRRAEAGFAALPLIAGAGKLLVVRAFVGNVRVRAIIDTGAQASIGNSALREALERRWRRQKASSDVITGATGDTQKGEGLPVSPISLGGIEIHNAHITFGDMHIFSHWDATEEPTILVGMDILGLVDTLVIDYHRQEVHIKPRYAGRPPPTG